LTVLNLSLSTGHFGSSSIVDHRSKLCGVWPDTDLGCPDPQKTSGSIYNH